MSLHKKPLTKIEHEGLKNHGLAICKPSQLSDVFRHGVSWTESIYADYRSHHHDFLSACGIAKENAKDDVDASYWQHQIDTLNKLAEQFV